MGNLQIKNLPEDKHDELRRRATQAGVTLRDYIIRLIDRDLAVPSAQDWLEELRSLKPVLGGESSADLIAAVRRERDRELDERLSR